MANPKPVHTLTRWKVLSNEEASELIDTGRMQRRVETPMGAKSLTNKQIYDMQQGQPLFVVSKGQYMMLAWQNGQVVAYEVEERKPKPPKSFAQKAREFFRGMFPLTVGVLMLTSCENFATRNFGGSQTIELEKGQRLVEITFKDNDLWILTEPMDSDYVPKTKTFYEDSNLGVMQGKITIVEQR
jgi:hypothetical protein